MPSPQVRGGIIQIQLNGEVLECKGDFNYGLGIPKRETIPGVDKIHGFKEVPQPAFIEGEITDRGSLDVAALQRMVDVTVTLKLANGKTILYEDAWYASEGAINTGEGNIAVRFESAEEAVEIAA